MVSLFHSGTPSTSSLDSNEDSSTPTPDPFSPSSVDPNLPNSTLGPTTFPTTQYTQPASGIGGDTCTDIPDWHDSQNGDCLWYASEDDLCSKFGSDHESMGHTANTACCACGGGTTADVPNPTSHPVPDTTPEPTPPPTIDFSSIEWADKCSMSSEWVYCDDGECQNRAETISNCQVRCRPDSCSSSSFDRSVVHCVGSGSCNSIFSGGDNGARFLASSVSCESGSCQEASFAACSCCDGDGCPPTSEVSSCFEDPVAFCESNYLGRPCSAWKNPVCTTLIETGTIASLEGLTTTACEESECKDTFFESQAVLCLGYSCSDSVFKDSVLECHDYACRAEHDREMVITKSSVTCLDGACQYMTLQDSTAQCNGYPSCSRSHVEKSETLCINGGCYEADIQNSIVDCFHGSCKGANVAHSNVTCFESSCEEADIAESYIECNGTCPTSFSRSVVTCAEHEDCTDASFKECSCCDGLGCPEVDIDGNVLQSCTVDINSFCSTNVDGKTCQEWGNPVCQTSTPTVKDVVPILSAETCSEGVDSLECSDNCGYKDIDFCPQIVCKRGDPFFGMATGCKTSTFSRTVVDCLGDVSCMQYSLFGNIYATFIVSQVNCTGTHSCESAPFLACSCCEGDCDGNEAPPCTEDNGGFCNSTYLGRSCASWGNPTCQGMEIPDPISLSKGVVCKGDECKAMIAEDAGILCLAGDCQYLHINQSMVECIDFDDEGSCSHLDATMSTVKCSGSSCAGSTFTKSAVNCLTASSCVNAEYGPCTCCDGEGCDGSVPSCQDDIESFCNSTCTGNPICSEDITANETSIII